MARLARIAIPDVSHHVTQRLPIFFSDQDRQVCAALGVTIVNGALSRDHGHLFGEILPHASHVSVSDFVRRARGRSSRKIQQEFGHLRKRRWGQRFRVRGYFSTTSGNITDDVVMNCPDKHTKPTQGLSQSRRTCRHQPVCHSANWHA